MSGDAPEATPTGLRSIFLPGTRGSRCAATPGWNQVPLQGTCRWAMCARGDVELGSDASTSKLTLGRSPGRGCAAEPGVRCFHRFPMRGEAVGGGGFGLPHGTTSNVTARSDSAPIVGARPAFWHPVRGAGLGGGGVPGVFASLDPRLISPAPPGHSRMDGEFDSPEQLGP